MKIIVIYFFCIFFSQPGEAVSWSEYKEEEPIGCGYVFASVLSSVCRLLEGDSDDSNRLCHSLRDDLPESTRPKEKQE